MAAPIPSSQPRYPALYLYPLNESFIPKHIPLSGMKHVKIGRQTNPKNVPSEINGYFDSKILSRHHAEVWEEGGKIFIKDVKSSNGTFINGDRLSPEGIVSEPYELKSDDIVQFGVDIIGLDNETIIHHKVPARVVCVLNDQDLQIAVRAEQLHQRTEGIMNGPPPQYPALYLYPINDSFIPKHITLSGNRRVEIGRQTNAETAQSDKNGYFDLEVLSRQHAEVWEEGGKIFIKDVKSSTGTFINGSRLSPEGIESEPYGLESDDIVEFGVDIIDLYDKTIVYHKVAARVVCVFNHQDAAQAEQHQQRDSKTGVVMNETGTKNNVQFKQEKGPLASLLTILISKGTVDDGIINENLGLVREVLDSSDYDGIISAVKDPLDAELLIDFTIYLIQGMHLSTSGIEDGNRKARKLIFDLISKTDVMPRSLFINDVTVGPDLDATMGDSGCGFRGQHKGRQVILRLTYQIRHEDVNSFPVSALHADSSSNNSETKNYYRDVLVWRSLCHRYILPLLGIYEVKSRFFLVLPLMINGTLAEWRKKQPLPDVAHIHKLMREVAEGLRYIHSEGIVHGDLYGDNILLDSTFRCQISGFGLARDSAATTSSMLNFVAPEIFVWSDQPHLDTCYGTRARKTMQTDVYAFGCLYYAIFFDAVPFQEIEQEQIPRLVADGKRPTRLNTPQMDDRIWDVIQNCWSTNPSERPTMEQIVQRFTTISVLSLLETLSELDVLGTPLVNENTLRRMRELLDLPEHFIIQGTSEGNSNNIKLLLEFILFLLHQGSLMHCGIQDANQKARKLMLKLISTDAIPRSLFITDINTDFEPIAVGGFGRVFRGEYKGQKVALKMVDKGHRRKGSLTQDFCREALAWRSLSHRFILPLLGIFENKSQLYLVSPFMMNGTLSDWRKEQTPTIDELHRMILEVAEGILYIHSEGIVHGDLHGGNVLLDSDLHCQITDFGSTRHSEATVTQSTTALSIGFAAPELFGMCIKCGQFDCEGCHEGHEHRSKTMKTDIYAFGCLYYSTFFDTVPFRGTNDFQIIRLLTKGKRPRRLESPRMEDNTWSLIQRCWESIPSERPTMEQIVETLTA